MIIDAINGRSHDELDYCIQLYMSAKAAEPDLPSQDLLVETSHTRRVQVSVAEDKKCEESYLFQLLFSHVYLVVNY